MVPAPGRVAQPVLDDHEVAVAAGVGAGEDRRADAGRLRGSPVCQMGPGSRSPGVEGVAGAAVASRRAEAVADRAGRGKGRVNSGPSRTGVVVVPGLGDAALRRRSALTVSGAGDPVDRRGRASAGSPRSPRCDVPAPSAPWIPTRAGTRAGHEQELQPPRQSQPRLPQMHQPRADARASRGACRARAASVRPGDAVDREPTAALEAHHGVPGERAPDPVDEALIQVQARQRGLQGSHVRATRLGRSRDEKHHRQSQENDPGTGHPRAGHAPHVGQWLGQPSRPARDRAWSCRACSVT